jgi:GT2 family glycosyltransferase
VLRNTDVGLKLTVGIPTLGNYQTLHRVLDGLGQQTVGTDVFEVVVVADEAEPDIGEVENAIGERPFPIRLLVGSVPGASANRNKVLDTARGPLILFIDNDTIPCETLVEEHLQWHDRWPDENVGILGRVRWATELQVTPFMRWLESSMLFDFVGIRGDDAGWGRFVTANSSVKRSFADRVGHFDAINLPYGYEDTDWAYRASRLGFRLMYNRRAVVDHLKPIDLDGWKGHLSRIATAEHRFCQLHPELDPWFHRAFTWAISTPPVTSSQLRWAAHIPRWLPVVGPRSARRMDRFYKQKLAPDYLDAWDRVATANSKTDLGGPGQV